MNRLFLLLLIVVLPLRGWAGDLMSVQMAMNGLALQAAEIAMPADCPMQSMQAAASTDDTTQAPAGVPDCTTCDLCLPIAELASARFDLAPFAARAAPPLRGVAFFSASPAHALKPPIS